LPQSISIAQLAAQLKKDAIAPLYALIGEEDLLRDAGLTLIKQAVLGEDGNDFNNDLFYGDEAEGAAIVTCASEVAVFAPRRLVTVKAADKLPAKQVEALLPYLKAPNETTTVVFTAAKLDGRLKFSQVLTQAAVGVDCAPLKDSQLIPWLKQEADRLGLRLDEPLALADVGHAIDPGALRRLERLGLAERRGRAVGLTPRGRFLGDAVTAELLA